MIRDLLLGDLVPKNGIIYGGKNAFIFANTSERNTIKRISFREFNERTDRVAQMLLKVGVRKGDRVAIIDYDTIERVEVEFGVFKIGAILVPVNWRFIPEEFLYVLTDSEPIVLIVRNDFVERIESIRNDLGFVKKFIVIGPQIEKWISYERTTESAPNDQPPSPNITEGDLAMLIYTAGSTGRPKGVMLTHRNFLAVCAEGHVTAQLVFGDITLLSAPLFHSGGHAVFIQNFYLGNTGILLQRFDAEFVLEVIGLEKVTNIRGIVTMWQKIMEVSGLENYDLTSVRTIGYGGSPINEPLLKRMLEVFPKNVRFGTVLGATETAGYAITALSSRDYILEGATEELNKKEKRLLSVGVPCPNMLLKIGNEDGSEVPIGEEGELLLRGPNIMQGYWRNPKATEQVFIDGWFRLQDIGKMDENGYVFLLDRKHNMIISGGENIYPAEIERVLVKHPAILEAAVIGVPDERWGETVKAIVTLKKGATASESEIIGFCKERLASFKKPRSVDFVKAIPKTGPGKIDKKKLRDFYRRNMEKQFQ